MPPIGGKSFSECKGEKIEKTDFYYKILIALSRRDIGNDLSLSRSRRRDVRFKYRTSKHLTDFFRPLKFTSHDLQMSQELCYIFEETAIFHL